MSAELPLSMRILLMLNPFIISIITRGSLCSYFTPLTSSFEKKDVPVCPSLLHGWYLVDAIHLPLLWFPEGFEQSSYWWPSVIVFISSIALCGRWDVWSSSLGEASCLSLLLALDLLESPFLTYFYNFPFQMSSSICSFKSLQSSVQWLWSLWKL